MLINKNYTIYISYNEIYYIKIAQNIKIINKFQKFMTFQISNLK